MGGFLPLVLTYIYPWYSLYVCLYDVYVGFLLLFILVVLYDTPKLFDSDKYIYFQYWIWFHIFFFVWFRWFHHFRQHYFLGFLRLEFLSSFTLFIFLIYHVNLLLVWYIEFIPKSLSSSFIWKFSMWCLNISTINILLTYETCLLNILC